MTHKHLFHKGSVIYIIILCSSILHSCQIGLYDLEYNSYVYESQGINSPNRGDWVNRVFSSDGKVGFFHSSIALCPCYFEVKKGDIVISAIDNYRIDVFEYSEADEDHFILNAGWGTYPNYLSVIYPTGCYTVQNDGYVRVQMRHTNPSSILDDIPIDAASFSGGFYVIHQDSSEYEIYRDKAIYPDYSEISKTITISNDGTIIGNQLWLFGASEEYVSEQYGFDNRIYIYDFASESLTYKTHNFGHANCVDYNPRNDYLLVTDALGYDSKKGRDVELILYKNPESSVLLSREDALVIPLYKPTDKGVNKSSYIYAQFVWGNNDDILIGFEYHYWGKSIFKIQLGKGQEDYSVLPDGYGSFLDGKSENELNGTCRLLAVYDGSIKVGIDAKYVLNSSYIPGAQGMCYNNNLFLCWGTLGGSSILEIELDDINSTYHVVNSWCISHIDDNGKEMPMEPEAVAVKDYRVFCGFRNANTKTYRLLSFDIV